MHVVLITVVLGVAGRNIEFATGQDSYLNPDSQIALDNVEFQEDFGGETIILLFSAEEGSDVSDLFVGENLDKLQAMTAEIEQVVGGPPARAQLMYQPEVRGRSNGARVVVTR